jgi:hypothetical protein
MIPAYTRSAGVPARSNAANSAALGLRNDRHQSWLAAGEDACTPGMNLNTTLDFRLQTRDLSNVFPSHS